MEELSVSSLLAAFPETKTQITEFSLRLVNRILDGHVNPLQSEAQMACLENLVKEIRSNSDYKAAVLSEAEKYNVKSFDDFNANYQIKEVGSKWHYEDCNMPRLDRICAEIEYLEEKKKTLEKMLQSIKEPEDYLDPISGEVTQIRPAYKTSTTQVVTTIKK